MWLSTWKQLTVVMPPAKREAHCNQSSLQCAERQQMKSWGVDVSAGEHPARGSVGFYGEKKKRAQRRWQLTEHRQSPGPIPGSIFAWNCQYLCTAKYCPIEIKKKKLAVAARNSAWDYFASKELFTACSVYPINIKLHLTGSCAFWTYPDSQSMEVEAGEGYDYW